MSTSKDMPTIAIAGGGIGGLAVAAFLRQHGYKKIQIYEARSREEVMKQTEFGNGIQLYFQCVRMLKAAGLPIDEHVHPCDIQMRRDDGMLLTDVSRPAYLKLDPSLKATKTAAYCMFRNKLHAILLEATPPESLGFNKKCINVIETDAFVSLQFEDGTTAAADFLIGADGVHSKVVSAIHKKPRALKRHSIVIVQGYSEYVPEKEANMESWTFNRKGGSLGVCPCVLPSGSKGTFWWATADSADLKGKELKTADDMWDFWAHQASRYSYEKVGPMFKGTIKESLSKWQIQDKDPLLKWVSKKGRVALLGDACHAALPSTGYGAGMAIEDGFWLVEALGDDPTVLLDEKTRIKALMKYQKRRAKYTANIVNKGRALMSLVHPKWAILRGICNFMWGTGIAGKFAARDLVGVLSQGLKDTKWTDKEKKQGRLDV